jgi:hypothetical protein
MSNYPQYWPKGTELRPSSISLRDLREFAIGIRKPVVAYFDFMVGIDHRGRLRFDVTDPNYYPMFVVHVRRDVDFASVCVTDGDYIWTVAYSDDNIAQLSTTRFLPELPSKETIIEAIKPHM